MTYYDRIAQVFERRKEMIELLSKGAKLKDVVKIISEKYHMPTKHVYRDWENRSKWLPMLKLDDKVFVYQIVENLRSLTYHTWQIFAHSESNATRLKCLQLLRDLSFDNVDVMQKLGLIPKAPEKHEVKQEVSIRDYICDLLRKQDEQRLADQQGTVRGDNSGEQVH